MLLLNHLHPKIRDSAIAAWHEACLTTPAWVHPKVIQTMRSFAESDHDFALGRTIINPDGESPENSMGNIISNARAGQSYHNYGLALDLNLIINGREGNPPGEDVINIFIKRGFTWGGNFTGKFKDPPHFENRCGYNWQQLLALYDKQEFIPGTTYLKI